VGQYFEPLQSYTKPAGVHPLDIQKLNPLYVWLICLVSFNMLVAGNGMSKLYGVIAGSSSTQLSDGEIRYQQEKVSIGIGSVIILIIVIKVLIKSTTVNACCLTRCTRGWRVCTPTPRERSENWSTPSSDPLCRACRCRPPAVA
jgi:hypothetical protein